MKITFEEFKSKQDWIHKEVLHSLTDEVISKANKDQFLDVKLLVNGVELEPKYYNIILSNIEGYIESKANSLLVDKLSMAKFKAQRLCEMIDEAIDNISYQIENITLID